MIIIIDQLLDKVNEGTAAGEYGYPDSETLTHHDVGGKA